MQNIFDLILLYKSIAIRFISTLTSDRDQRPGRSRANPFFRAGCNAIGVAFHELIIILLVIMTNKPQITL